MLGAVWPVIMSRGTAESLGCALRVVPHWPAATVHKRARQWGEIQPPQQWRYLLPFYLGLWLGQPPSVLPFGFYLLFCSIVKDGRASGRQVKPMDAAGNAVFTATDLAGYLRHAQSLRPECA
jgi:hypothetical protein